MSKRDVIVPLDIPDIRVLRTELSEKNELLIVVESTKGGVRCRKCGEWINKAHGQDEWVTIRHLPAFGRPGYLRYRPKRYQCGNCEGYPTTIHSHFANCFRFVTSTNALTFSLNRLYNS